MYLMWCSKPSNTICEKNQKKVLSIQSIQAILSYIGTQGEAEIAIITEKNYLVQNVGQTDQIIRARSGQKRNTTLGHQ